MMEILNEFQTKDTKCNVYALVSFIGGGNWRPEKSPNLTQVTNKLLSHNVVSSTPRHEQNSNSQL
jgi:hypothetical protein